MPWYAWFSDKQRKLYGYAFYINKKGEKISVTEVNINPNYKHPYKDNIKLGQVTHYCYVVERNHTKKRGKEPSKMKPFELLHTTTEIFSPSLIIN